jgi:hypothetical protein
MSPPKKKPLTAIHLTILKLLREHPEGLDIEQIRALGKIEGQQHLDKRVRELYPISSAVPRKPCENRLGVKSAKVSWSRLFLTK